MADDSTQSHPAGGAADGGPGFSQDEIDKLFAASGTGGSVPSDVPARPAPATQAAAGGDGINLSQDELDALLAGAGLADVAASGASTPVAGEASSSAGPPSPAPAVPTGSAKLDAYGRPFDEAAAAMAAAIEEERAAAASKPKPAPAAGPVQAKPLEAGGLPQFTPGVANGRSEPEGLDLLLDVNLRVKVELGRTRMLVEDVLRLDQGSVVELDRLAGDPVDIYANDRLVARGEILVLNDNFCIRISEIITLDPHRVGAA